MEEPKKVKRESDRKRAKTRVNGQALTQQRAPESVPPLICVSTYHLNSRWFKTSIRFTRLFLFFLHL